MEQLLAAQSLQWQRARTTAEQKSEILRLRANVPAPILGHFDRLMARGKKGVAMVRHGVCCECHLQITSGTLARLAHTDEVQLCDNCGRYLYLVEEPAAAPEPVSSLKPPARRVKKKSGEQVG